MLRSLGEVSEAAKELALKWAPLVWLHPEDVFYPSNVDFYLENMEVNELQITVVSRYWYPLRTSSTLK